ncbi:3-oxoadipate enol-lactonase [Noviherbaspirillum denitrificans]|uniref:3-oxoadipate enol-lactonase n=1 Tax=Noviherbaspirillum denitrificans TaxID=1968433 RepID=A0A254TIU1_9BURK|nr:3-oxoadipate enol-lactonase [Noviherbaspirillum denitrificans]OWW22504.1 3-oxoadipate enol-lactonase [Noviherbaspirillum denitrificans]
MPFASVNGIKLHYQLDGDPSLPVLVLSNSLGTSLSMWDPQIPEFSRHFRVLRYDTRGHGQSEVAPGPYNIATLAADVIALLDHLEIPCAHFCGLSMGGSTFMYLALHYPARVRKLILCNTGAQIGTADGWNSRIDIVKREGMTAIAQAVVSRWLTPAYSQQHPEQVATLTNMLLATPAEGYAAACAAVRDNDLRDVIAGISAPTLVIAGTGDVPTPPADGQFMRSHIPGARYVEFDAAHISNQQQPEAFTRAVVQFLTE